MKEDVPCNDPRGLLLILDSEMALFDGIILFHNYTAPMESKVTILARSSMSLGSKINILVAEECRILRNCSLELPSAVRVEHVSR